MSELRYLAPVLQNSEVERGLTSESQSSNWNA